MTEVAALAALGALGWALAWWDVRRRQHASLRAAEVAAFHMKLDALAAKFAEADAGTVDVIRSLARELKTVQMALSMTRNKVLRGRYAEAAAANEDST